MSKGVAKVTNLGQQGLVTHNNAPNWDFLYEVSTVRNPNYNIGDRVVTPDGRVFRYAKSGAACWTGRGCTFYNAIPATGIDYGTIAASASIGDTSIQMVSGAIAQTEDGLRGGTIVLKTVSGSNDSALQQRLIIGNTACAISGTTTIYLDAALTGALTTSSYAFCMPSPYSDLRLPQSAGLGSVCSYAGIPAVYVDAANKYFWVQTWGLIWISPQDEVGKTTYRREVVFKEDGTIRHRGTTDATFLHGQTAGFIVDNNAAENGATQIMLTVSP